jgi:hypothetical protein
MAPEVQLEVTSTLTPAIAADTETSSSADHVETSTATPGDAGSGSGSGGGDALPPPPLKASAGTEAAACCPAAELDDLMLLGILRCMPDMDLVALRVRRRRCASWLLAAALGALEGQEAALRGLHPTRPSRTKCVA